MKPPRRSNRFTERGVALLLVLVGVAVLALVANEVRYNSVVELRLATNQRDEVRAHFLAESAVGLSRLILKFQKQMDSIQMPNLSSILGANSPLAKLLPPGMAGAAGAAGAGAGAQSSMSIQIWRMAKIDCYMLQGLVKEDETKKAFAAPHPVASRSKKLEFDDENPALAEKQSKRKFGGFEGCFNAVISDEEEKINLNKLDAPQLTSAVLLAQMLAAFGDKKYEFLFEREDSNRIKVVPSDVIIAMRDWIDEDEVGTQLNFSGQGDPFQKGFSDENFNYDRYDPRYKAKNGRFDSLDELYMVHGVNDRFMAAFRDRLTVYPDINSRLNINTDDPMLLELAIRSVADPSKTDPRLSDPLFIDAVIKKIRAARMFAMFGMSVNDFISILQTAGIATNPTISNNVQNQRYIGDKSTTFQIHATGVAGDVTRTVTAVIRLDDGLGRLVYWRED